MSRSRPERYSSHYAHRVKKAQSPGDDLPVSPVRCRPTMFRIAQSAYRRAIFQMRQPWRRCVHMPCCLASLRLAFPLMPRSHLPARSGSEIKHGGFPADRPQGRRAGQAVQPPRERSHLPLPASCRDTGEATVALLHHRRGSSCVRR